MARNELPRSRSGLKLGCLLMREGCEALQDSIGLMHCSASVLDGAFSNLEEKERAAIAGRRARAQAITGLQDLDDQAAVLLQKTSHSLRNVLSNRFSDAWRECSWPGTSVSVPASRDARIILCGDLQAFYQVRAEFEEPKQDITAVKFGQLYDSLVAARSAVQAAITDAAKNQTALAAAEGQLRQKMRDLIVELSRLLPGSDPRWRRFGLNLPDAPEAPAVPKNVMVNNGIAGKLLVTCGPVPGASHYRFWTQRQGTHEKPVAAGSAQEPQFLIEGLTSDQTFDVYVSAVNEAGSESTLSAAVTAAVTALAA